MTLRFEASYVPRSEVGGGRSSNQDRGSPAFRPCLNLHDSFSFVDTSTTVGVQILTPPKGRETPGLAHSCNSSAQQDVVPLGFSRSSTSRRCPALHMPRQTGDLCASWASDSFPPQHGQGMALVASRRQSEFAPGRRNLGVGHRWRIVIRLGSPCARRCRDEQVKPEPSQLEGHCYTLPADMAHEGSFRG